MSERIVLLSGRNSLILSQRIAGKIEMPLTEVEITKFADGEFEPQIKENIRGSRCFIVQSTNPPTENLLELLLIIDACKRASVKEIFVVIPYFGFARQDKKNKPRIPIGAKLISNLLFASGANHLITMDLHANQIQGFFDIPVDHLYSSAIFVPYIEKLGLENIMMASPDTGGSVRAGKYAEYFNCEMALFYKKRAQANKVKEMKLVGDVTNKNVFLLDDMIDTAGTLTKAATIIMDNGALSVRALCPHGVFSLDAVKKIEESPMLEVVVTDTIPSVYNKSFEKIKILSCADIFAETIKRTKNNESISSIFVF